MSGSLLFDTNIIIAIIENDMAVTARLTASQRLFLPSIAIGELFYGAFRSGRREQNLARLERFLLRHVIVPCDMNTARHYGAIQQVASERGRPSPQNDLWIAAVARQHDLILVTRDAHFGGIPGLTVEYW